MIPYRAIGLAFSLALLLASQPGCVSVAEQRQASESSSSYTLCSKLVNAVLAPRETREVWAMELQRRGENCAQHMPAIEASMARDQQVMELSRQLQQPRSTLAAPAPSPGVGHLKRQYTSGMNRICIYDRLGSEAALTVSAASLCPLTY